jgi:cob(I)alamin adenosyltransferase
MGHRLSKIYTRTGDAGSTGLADGSRVAKDSARIAALGELDELNSMVGLLLTEELPGAALLSEKSVAGLEQAIDRYNETLGPLKEFILPGGTRAAALAHLARAVCRRAERQLVALAAAEAVSETGRKYVNRLSDLLFVLGRTLNRAGGRGDVLWQKNRERA